MAAEAAKVGQRIQKLREDHDLSLSQFARNAGISKGYLWKLERGDVDVRPSGETLFKLARALGVSISALIGQSVLVDEPEDIPVSLQKFADEEGLGEQEKAMLAQVNLRGEQPTDPDDWAFIWHAIKRSVPKA